VNLVIAYGENKNHSIASKKFAITWKKPIIVPKKNKLKVFVLLCTYYYVRGKV